MTIELTNLPFKHDDFDNDVDMEALAMQMNAIEPGAGAQETATHLDLMPQLVGTETGTTLLVVAGIIALSFLAVSFKKHKPKFSKIAK